MPPKKKGLPGFASDPNTLKCKRCEKPLSFLLQAYTGGYFEAEYAFHRTVFVFCCTTQQCYKDKYPTFKALRSQLPRYNTFFSPNVSDNTDPEAALYTHNKAYAAQESSLCKVCGFPGGLRCSSCKSCNYCSKEHQLWHWHHGHQAECERHKKAKADALATFASAFVVAAEGAGVGAGGDGNGAAAAAAAAGAAAPPATAAPTPTAEPQPEMADVATSPDSASAPAPAACSTAAASSSAAGTEAAAVAAAIAAAQFEPPDKFPAQVLPEMELIIDGEPEGAEVDPAAKGKTDEELMAASRNPSLSHW